MNRLPIVLLLAMLSASRAWGAAADFSNVPGVVIAHWPASSQIYVGSPGIAILRDGVYLAKCDEFGPATTEHQRAVTHVFRSDDRGATWRPTAAWPACSGQASSPIAALCTCWERRNTTDAS